MLWLVDQGERILTHLGQSVKRRTLSPHELEWPAWSTMFHVKHFATRENWDEQTLTTLL